MPKPKNRPAGRRGASGAGAKTALRRGKAKASRKPPAGGRGKSGKDGGDALPASQRRGSTTKRGRSPSATAGMGAALILRTWPSGPGSASRDAHASIDVELKRPAGRAAEAFPASEDRVKAADRLTRTASRRLDPLADLLASAAHPKRLMILMKLLGGEATKELLTKATGLKAGPLYYHLRELRSAGLIGPKVRDLYVITDKGSRLALSLLAVDKACR